MTQKRISFYSDTHATKGGQLIMEIGANQAVTLVRDSDTQLTEALEVFDYDTTNHSWSEIFSEIQKTSELLNRSYGDTRIYYNFPEALIIPESKFSTEAGKDYLDQIYGESVQDETGSEKITAGNGMAVVYRIKKPIVEWVNRQFPGYNHHTSHIYTEILKSLYQQALPEGNFTSIRFYHKHLVVAVLKNKQLQLIQSFNYDVDEDILYYLLSLIQQFELNPDFSAVEISGEFDKKSMIAQQLPNLFTSITWVDSEAKGIFSAVTAAHPAHYFTPYAKLGI